jgi:integrase
VEKEKEKEIKKKRCRKKNYDHEIDKFLPEDKMILLENTPFEGRLQMYADIFIILQRTGINFTDYDQMDWKKAIKKMGEKEILELYRSKSGQKAIIPVLPSLKKILEKYNYQPPKRSPSMLNLQLKKIAELIGFDMPLSLKFGRKTITNLFLEKGVSIEVTAKVLGHKDLTMVQKHYAQIKHNRVLMEIIDKSL